MAAAGVGGAKPVAPGRSRENFAVEPSAVTSVGSLGVWPPDRSGRADGAAPPLPECGPGGGGANP